MERDIQNVEEFLDEVQVEAIYGIPRRTLQTWRYLKKNLPFHRLGRLVRYRRSDCEKFAQTNLVTVDA